MERNWKSKKLWESGFDGIDKLIHKFRQNEKQNFILNENNLLKQIKKRLIISSKSDILYVIFLPWGSKIEDGSKLQNFFENKVSFLIYEFPSEILSNNIDLTTRCFKIIRDKVLKDLNKLDKYHRFSSINFIGINLGCVNALMISNIFHNINSIILITPGHCLAESLWKGIATEHIKHELEREGVKLKDLEYSWRELAPKNNLNNLKKTNIFVYLSKSDEIVPYDCGRKLIQSMKSRGLNPVIKENLFLGHYLTILNFYNFPGNFLNKLKN